MILSLERCTVGREESCGTKTENLRDRGAEKHNSMTSLSGVKMLLMLPTDEGLKAQS